MLKTNIDRIMEVLNTKKDVSLHDLSKELSIPIAHLESTAKLLEGDRKVKIEYKFMKPHLILIEEKENKSAQPNKKEEGPIKATGNIFDNSTDTQDSNKIDDKKYSTLGQEEISGFSKELSPFEQEKKEKEKKEHQKVVVVNPIANKETEKKEDKPIEPKQEEKDKVIDADTNYYDISNENDELFEDKNYLLNELSGLEKIDFMIEEANKQLDEDKIKQIHKIYEEIYKEFSTLENISTNEKNILKDKIAILFNRIKVRFLEENIY